MRYWLIIAASLALLAAAACLAQPDSNWWTGPTITIWENGTVTPSDAPIVPCGDGTLCLTANVLAYPSGIVVRAPGVVLEGGNHTVKGYGAGIGVHLLSSATVRNVTVSDFEVGVRIEGTGTVSHVIITSTVVGASIENAGRLQNARVQSAGTGLQVRAAGFAINVNVSSVGLDGVVVRDTSGARLERVTVENYGRHGIVLSGSEGVYVLLARVLTQPTWSGYSLVVEGTRYSTVSGEFRGPCLVNNSHGNTFQSVAVILSGQETRDGMRFERSANNTVSGGYGVCYKPFCAVYSLYRSPNNTIAGATVQLGGISVVESNRTVLDSVVISEAYYLGVKLERSHYSRIRNVAVSSYLSGSMGLHIIQSNYTRVEGGVYEGFGYNDPWISVYKSNYTVFEGTRYYSGGKQVLVQGSVSVAFSRVYTSTMSGGVNIHAVGSRRITVYSSQMNYVSVVLLLENCSEVSVYNLSSFNPSSVIWAQHTSDITVTRLTARYVVYGIYLLNCSRFSIRDSVLSDANQALMYIANCSSVEIVRTGAVLVGSSSYYSKGDTLIYNSSDVFIRDSAFYNAYAKNVGFRGRYLFNISVSESFTVEDAYDLTFERFTDAKGGTGLTIIRGARLLIKDVSCDPFYTCVTLRGVNSTVVRGVKGGGVNIEGCRDTWLVNSNTSVSVSRSRGVVLVNNTLGGVGLYGIMDTSTTPWTLERTGPVYVANNTIRSVIAYLTVAIFSGNKIGSMDSYGMGHSWFICNNFTGNPGYGGGPWPALYLRYLVGYDCRQGTCTVAGSAGNENLTLTLNAFQGAGGVLIESGNGVNNFTKNALLTRVVSNATTHWLSNYWRDYTGSDSDGDGYGDTPYSVPGTAGDVDPKPSMNAKFLEVCPLYVLPQPPPSLPPPGNQTQPPSQPPPQTPPQPPPQTPPQPPSQPPSVPGGPSQPPQVEQPAEQGGWWARLESLIRALLRYWWLLLLIAVLALLLWYSLRRRAAIGFELPDGLTIG